MSAAAAAVETLRRCVSALASPGLDAADRERIAALAAAALALLEAAGRSRLPTVALAARVQQLERSLADFDPGERRAAICQRLGVSRSRYYQLRAQIPKSAGLAPGNVES